ncbi:MAG: hypothetical protein GF410_16740 [Chitinivibrionales bacterium]|nr:hypothetical protein [Chitinivibrionales bacterium]
METQILLEELAAQAGMSENDYENMILESWVVDHTYQCPECSARVVNGRTCSCKASDRL